MPIRILAFVFILPFFVACQQDQEKDLPLVVQTNMDSIFNEAQISGDPQPSAANMVYQSVDGGETWENVEIGLHKGFQAWRLVANANEVYLGTEAGFYRSHTGDTAAIWKKEVFLDENSTDIFPGLSGPYAYSQEGVFFREMQGSGIWIPIGNTLEGRAVHTFLESPDGTIFVGSDNGIYKSTDGCKSWKKVFDETMVTTLAATDGFLFAGGLMGLLRSADGGEHWDWVHTQDGRAAQIGLINGGIAAIFEGEDGSTEQANVPGMKNSLLASYDNGNSWEPIDDDLPAVRYIYEIVQADEFLFCSLDAGIFRSTDNGKTWKLVRPGNDKERYALVVSCKTVFAIRTSGGC